MSENHLKSCFILMYFEFKEDGVLERKYNEYKTSQDDLESYKNTGDFYKQVQDDEEMSAEDERLFDELDIDELDDALSNG